MNKRTPKRNRATRPKASTQDIVGVRLKNPAARVPRKWREHYERLVEIRERLVARQDTLSGEAAEESPTYSSHMADAATDNFDRDLALGMLSSEQAALYQIDQAIDRIRTGSYGKCELTGKPIEPARLEAIPWTRFSLEAEKKLEQEGARRRPGLGARETVGATEAAEDQEPEEAQ